MSENVERRPLAGRHAIVTGGGRGIGSVVVTRLATLGARVSVMGRDPAPLEAVCRLDADLLPVSVDVTDEASVGEAVATARERFGPVQILVNNAGLAESAPLPKTTTSLWQRTLDVNLTGTFFMMREALPDMREAGFGRIVNIASVAGINGYAYVGAYCASKHGVIGLTRAAAAETARQGITVNAICPGYTETDMLARTLRNIADKTGCSTDEAAESLKAINPQHRFIAPEEVADAVAYLTGPGSASVTGQALVIAGGEVMP